MIIGFPIASALIAVVSMATLAGRSAYAAPCPLTTASASVTLSPGTYDCRNGVAIGADNVTLDCQGATLVGAFSGGSRTFGVTTLSRTNVTINVLSDTGRAQPGVGHPPEREHRHPDHKQPCRPLQPRHEYSEPVWAAGGRRGRLCHVLLVHD